jgi:putative Holliday junction resolvase
MRTLGIDHGEKRVGLAISDEDGQFAQPRSTLARKNPDELLRTIAGIVKDEHVEEIVVGLPLHLDGSVGASARRAQRFADRLKALTELPVIMWDERMTTALAERALDEAGVKRRNQKDKIDRVAAAILLQSYLDSKKESAWRASGPRGGGADGEP